MDNGNYLLRSTELLLCPMHCSKLSVYVAGVHFIPATDFLGNYCYSLPFTDEEMEAWRGKGTCPGSPSCHHRVLLLATPSLLLSHLSPESLYVSRADAAGASARPHRLGLPEQHLH